MARSCTLVPTPIFSVEPIRTATWPERQAANSRARSVSFLASCTNRTDSAGQARVRRAGRGVRRRRSSRARGCPGRRTRAAATRAPGTESRRVPGIRRRGGPRQMAAIRSAAASILPGRALRQADQAQVQGGAAAVAGHLEHVVFFGADSPVADRARPARRGRRRSRSVPRRAATVTVSGTRRPSPGRSARLGTGRSRSAAVLTSAKTCHMRSISGTLRNLANRLLTRKLSPPSGASSTWVTTWPKVAAQLSNTSIPAASSRSGRR